MPTRLDLAQRTLAGGHDTLAYGDKDNCTAMQKQTWGEEQQHLGSCAQSRIKQYIDTTSI